MKAAGDRPGHLSRTSPPQGEKRYPFRQPAPPKGPRRLTGVLPSGHADSSYSLMEAWVAPLPRGCPRPESLLPESSTARLPFRWGTAQPGVAPVAARLEPVPFSRKPRYGPLALGETCGPGFTSIMAGELPSPRPVAAGPEGPRPREPSSGEEAASDARPSD